MSAGAMRSVALGAAALVVLAHELAAARAQGTGATQATTPAASALPATSLYQVPLQVTRNRRDWMAHGYAYQRQAAGYSGLLASLENQRKARAVRSGFFLTLFTLSLIHI